MSAITGVISDIHFLEYPFPMLETGAAATRWLRPLCWPDKAAEHPSTFPQSLPLRVERSSPNNSACPRPHSLSCAATTAPFALGKATPHPPNEHQEGCESKSHTRQDENGVVTGLPLVPVVPPLRKSGDLVRTAKCASLKNGKRSHMGRSHVARFRSPVPWEVDRMMCCLYQSQYYRSGFPLTMAYLGDTT